MQVSTKGRPPGYSEDHRDRSLLLLLSLARNLNIGITAATLDNEEMGELMSRFYQQHNRARKLYYHPAVVRMASTILEDAMQEILEDQDYAIKKLKEEQQSNKQ